jgi:hypothetical protein
MMANESQKPPYDDSAVAPKVFPTAISLQATVSVPFIGSIGCYIPHAGQQLDQTTIAKGQPDDDAGIGDVARAHVDAAEHERGQGETAQAERRRVTELALADRPVQTRLELTTEGR